MPIKFRCQHCRQFLGISHMKAGSLVDCPTCGRTIRVPDPEGNVEPLPELKLNLQDRMLATALEELAMLGRSDAEIESEAAVAVAEGDGPTPKPATQAPTAPVPIRMEPLVPVKPIPLQIHDTRTPAAVASMQELAALAQLPTTRDPAVEQPFISADPLFNGFAGARPSSRRGLSVSWVAAIATVTFWIGFVTGSWNRSPKTNAAALPEAPAKVVAGQEPTPDPFAKANKLPAVRGRITFVTDAGERRPDHGARVLLLPEKREGSAKLSIVGFRSADSDKDAQLASGGLRAMGGDVAVVDDSGNFEVGSLKPGTYRILALSHFQPGEDKAPIDASLKGILDSFFDRSEQLLGKCRYHLRELKYSGKETELWDHSFERE